jgi:hypothetical protein
VCSLTDLTELTLRTLYRVLFFIGVLSIIAPAAKASLVTFNFSAGQIINAIDSLPDPGGFATPFSGKCGSVWQYAGQCAFEYVSAQVVAVGGTPVTIDDYTLSNPAGPSDWDAASVDLSFFSNAVVWTETNPTPAFVYLTRSNLVQKLALNQLFSVALSVDSGISPNYSKYTPVTWEFFVVGFKVGTTDKNLGQYFTLTTNAVPEPSTFALAGAALLGLVMRRRMPGLSR